MISAFGEDGYFTVHDLFTDAECDAITAEIERSAFELALGEVDDGPLSYRPAMRLANPALKAVATDRLSMRWFGLVVS